MSYPETANGRGVTMGGVGCTHWDKIIEETLDQAEKLKQALKAQSSFNIDHFDYPSDDSRGNNEHVAQSYFNTNTKSPAIDKENFEVVM